MFLSEHVRVEETEYIRLALTSANKLILIMFTSVLTNTSQFVGIIMIYTFQSYINFQEKL